MQPPTHSRLKVATSADARAALFLVECLLLHPVRRRPDDAEKAQISHGQVFIWLDGAKGETGLERWTDGRSWGPSRCRDDFLIYEEKTGDHRLTKSTYTARRNTLGDPGALWHLIAYYYADETHNLIDMYTDPTFSQCTSKMANGYFVSSRKDKSRKAKEVPPPVDVSPLSRYDELVASLQTSVSPGPQSHPNSAIAISPSSSHSSYPTNAYHHHNPHHHTHASAVTNANILPRAGRAPPSPQTLLAAQYEHFSITNGSPLRRDSSSSIASTQRRQELAPLRTFFNKNDDGDASNRGVNNSITDPALHALNHNTMRDPYQYKKVLAADYHRLPPPAGGDGFAEGGGERRAGERERYYSSSPSSSPSLSPDSSDSSPIEMDVDLPPSFARGNNVHGGAVFTRGYNHSRSSGNLGLKRTAAAVVAPTPVRACTASPGNLQSPLTPMCMGPQPIISLPPNSGSQTFERGGRVMTVIDVPTTTRSREDEKVLHELSKGWNLFF